MKSSIVSLGSGQILPWETHPSLSLLHQLKLFNFPIPNGVILLDPPHSTGIFESTSIQTFLNEIQSYELRDEIEIIFFINGSESKIGRFDGRQSSLTADLIKLSQIANLEFSKPSDRIDILVLEKVKLEPSGTKGCAISEDGYADDLIDFEFTSVDGMYPKMELLIDKLFLGERKIQGDFRGRIQDLLRSVRKALGEDGWKIQWVDDGQQVYLLSISKYSRERPRQDIYSASPFLSIIPQPTSPLLGQLTSESSRKLMHFFSHLTPELSSQRKFVILDNLELKFNLSLLRDFLRSFGLPSFPLRILFNSELSPIYPMKGIRFWRNLTRTARLVHEISLAPGIATRLEKRLSTFKTEPDKTAHELFVEWQNVFVATSHAIYRLWGTLFFQNSIFWFPFKRNIFLIEKSLRTVANRCLSQIQDALEMKALGWYSRGLLQSSDEIWQLSKEELIRLDQ